MESPSLSLSLSLACPAFGHGRTSLSLACLLANGLEREPPWEPSPTRCAQPSHWSFRVSCISIPRAVKEGFFRHRLETTATTLRVKSTVSTAGQEKVAHHLSTSMRTPPVFEASPSTPAKTNEARQLTRSLRLSGVDCEDIQWVQTGRRKCSPVPVSSIRRIPNFQGRP